MRDVQRYPVERSDESFLSCFAPERKSKRDSSLRSEGQKVFAEYAGEQRKLHGIGKNLYVDFARARPVKLA